MSLYGACQEPARNERKGCPTSCHSALRRRSRTWRQSHAAISRGVYRGNPTRQGPRSDRLAAMRDSTPAPGKCGEAEEQAGAEGSQTSSEFRRGDAAPGKCAMQLAFSPSSSLTSLGPQGVDIKARGEWKSLPAPLDHINLHVRGGYVLPWQEPAQNTHFRCVTSHLAQVLAKPSWAPKQLY